MSKAARGADMRVWEVATGLNPLGLKAHKWLILVRAWVVGRQNGMGHVEFCPNRQGCVVAPVHHVASC